MKTTVMAFGMAFALAAGASASIVQVQIHGEVEYNQIRNGLLNKTDIPAGSPTTVTFLLDSTQYMNDANFPTRGYFLDQASFVADFNGIQVGLQNPYQDGTPMFVLRDNDPAVDGFFLSNNTTFDWPVAMNVDGIFGPFGCHFAVGYTGDTLSSLNITDAIGHYDYTGLTNFYYATDDGGNDAMGLIFDSMDITLVPAPSAAGLLGIAGLTTLRRRR